MELIWKSHDVSIFGKLKFENCVYLHSMIQKKLHISEQEKLQHRLSLSYEERYKAAMRMIRLVHKLKQAKVVKPTN
jgi:hypothetical protein